MIEIRTNFTPYKMKISRREPVVLSLELINSGKEKEIVSFEFVLGQQFSLEKTGYKSEKTEKIPAFGPGEKKKYYFEIWPKQMLRAGEQGMRLTVIEHYQSFNYVKRKQEKVLKLTVEE